MKVKFNRTVVIAKLTEYSSIISILIYKAAINKIWFLYGLILSKRLSYYATKSSQVY